jgi:hypothetical protein
LAFEVCGEAPWCGVGDRARATVGVAAL